METATGLSIPWRMLREKLVALDAETKEAVYATTFQDHVPRPKISEATVVETLYRNKTSLEAIFRIIDKDNSGMSQFFFKFWPTLTFYDNVQYKLHGSLLGYITLDEFSDACALLSQHMPDPIPQEHLLDICRSMDINKDGQVDLNEFLETFRLVDIHKDLESPTGDFDGDSSPEEGKNDSHP